jgi:hypothetical protein
MYNNGFSGSVNITNSKPNLREFRLGNVTNRTGVQQNSYPQVDITGLTNVLVIDLSGCNIENLNLPNNTVCNTLHLFSNKLDIATNTDLKTKINAMTSLVTLRLGGAGDNPIFGQDSTNGFGQDLNLNNLNNLQQLIIGNCKISGTVTLPNTTNVITNILTTNNPDLEEIIGLDTALLNATTVSLSLCPNLRGDLVCPRVTNFPIENTGIDTIDISLRPTLAFFSTHLIRNNPNLTDMFLPNNSTYAIGSNTSLIISLNNNLANITNLEYIVMNTGTPSHAFFINDNSLNITFPIGVNQLIPRNMNISNNGMNQTNVDNTINNIYENRSKWTIHGIVNKPLNIAGTNAAPSGVYQEPSGFVLGESDGTPISAKEQIYVLVNNYNWTVTMN